jgi:outer membrane murein-binding lipoprotein Lpp
MIRRKLLIAAAIVASVVLTACSDMTAPKNACPIINGSQTCQ